MPIGDVILYECIVAQIFMPLKFTNYNYVTVLGPGDSLDSPLITMATTPRKTPTPTQVTLPPLSVEAEATPTSAGPDLDRSAVSLTRDHLISGSVAGSVSLSGEYRDASGKVIRRCIQLP